MQTHEKRYLIVRKSSPYLVKVGGKWNQVFHRVRLGFGQASKLHQLLKLLKKE